MPPWLSRRGNRLTTVCARNYGQFSVCIALTSAYCIV